MIKLILILGLLLSGCAFMAPRKVEHVIVCGEKRVSLSMCKRELEQHEQRRQD